MLIEDVSYTLYFKELYQHLPFLPTWGILQPIIHHTLQRLNKFFSRLDGHLLIEYGYEALLQELSRI
jgi:hypothetical protein